MKFLIDTNILISLEPQASDYVTIEPRESREFFRLVGRGGHELVLSDAQIQDLLRDQNESRSAARFSAIKHYRAIDVLHGIDGERDNDWVDNQLLETLDRGAVHFLITEDIRMHAKSRRRGIEESVLTFRQALELLRVQSAEYLIEFPHLTVAKAHTLDPRDTFFDSFREDYCGFDNWLVKCAREERTILLVRSQGDGQIMALAILKVERKLAGHDVLKICSFKVSEEHEGLRLSELLLNGLFRVAASKGIRNLYLTVYPKHERLIGVMGKYGFCQGETTCHSGEVMLEKVLALSASEFPDPMSLEDFMKYGPCAIRLPIADSYVVPIRPEYFRSLFPETEPQWSLIPERSVVTNGLRNSYLCRSNIRPPVEGSVMLFYKSGGEKAICGIGVVEHALRSNDIEEMCAFVGQRSVYTRAGIAKMMAGGVVLAINYRQVLAKAGFSLPLASLIAERSIRGYPQSITRLSPGAEAWIKKYLEALF